MRIVSLLPGATEIVCALGLRESLVGRSHECDFPADVLGLPPLTRARIDASQPSERIDEEVRAIRARGLPLYELDEVALAALAPDVVVTQEMCEVCAVSYEQVAAAVGRASLRTRVVSLGPSRLEDVFRDSRSVAEACGAPRRGDRLLAALRRRLERVAEGTGREGPRVAVIEWLAPLMLAGHWVPDVILAAGGKPLGPEPGLPSPYASWEEVRALSPDAVLVAPCGLDLGRTRAEAERLADAVRALAPRVLLMDGNAYLNRPGPRLVDAVETIAAWLRGSRGPRSLLQRRRTTATRGNGRGAYRRPTRSMKNMRNRRLLRPERYGSLRNRGGSMSRIGAMLLVALAVTGEGGSHVNDAAATPSSGLLLVANKGDHTLGIIDPGAGRQVATVEESGITGHEVVASPDGRTAFVPIYGDSGVGRPGTDGQTLDVIDIASRRRIATIDFGRPERPHCPLFGPDGRLYVTTELTSSITVIDPRNHRIVDRIPTGQPESHMLALTRDGKRAYTSNVGAGTVSAIDLAARKVVAVVPVSARAQRISLSVDDRWVFTADQTEPRLAVIDTATNGLKRWVALPGLAYGTAPTPDGRWLLVALIGVNKVGVLDMRSMQLARTIDVPKAPQEVVVRPDGRVAYVSCDASHQVAVIDLKEWKVERLIEAGPLADGLAWAVSRP